MLRRFGAGRHAGPGRITSRRIIISRRVRLRPRAAAARGLAELAAPGQPRPRLRLLRQGGRLLPRQAQRPHLLPAFPGLDGGKQATGATRTKKSGRRPLEPDRPRHGAVRRVSRRRASIVPKGVCVRLGEHGELAACFNPETLALRGRLARRVPQVLAVRHGFMDGLRPAGEILARAGGPAARTAVRLSRLLRHGQRVVFAYRLGDVEMLDAPWVKDGKFERASSRRRASIRCERPAGGPRAVAAGSSRCSGKLGADEPYAVDTIACRSRTRGRRCCSSATTTSCPTARRHGLHDEGDVWRVTASTTKLDERPLAAVRLRPASAARPGRRRGPDLRPRPRPDHAAARPERRRRGRLLRVLHQQAWPPRRPATTTSAAWRATPRAASTPPRASRG